MLLINYEILTWSEDCVISSATGATKFKIADLKQSGRLLGPLLKPGLSLIRNVLKPLAKSVLIPLRLTAGASYPTDAAAHKEMFGSNTTTLIISNEEMSDIMKIVKSLEESGLLIKGVSQKIKTEEKEQKWGFLRILSEV